MSRLFFFSDVSSITCVPHISYQKCESHVEKKGEMAGLDGCSVSSHIFQPLHIISDWVELGTTTKRFTVANLMLSAVSPRQFSVRVTEYGLNLEVKVI